MSVNLPLTVMYGLAFAHPAARQRRDGACVRVGTSAEWMSSACCSLFCLLGLALHHKLQDFLLSGSEKEQAVFLG